MTNVTRTVLLALITLGLAACASKETAPVEDTSTPEPMPEPEPVVETTGYQGPTDYTSKEGLDDPRNLLSKRVIYFDFDKSNVKPEYREILSAHATYMAANGGARVTLEGHADERGTREYNLGLGERRGNSAMGLLDAQGAASNQLSVVSYGEERPVSTCSNESCWSRNRRVEIVYTRVQ